jgi:hypothetical protein
VPAPRSPTTGPRGPLVFGAKTVGLDGETGEEQVDVAIDDVGASSTPTGPVCTHYTFHGEDDTLGSGVIAGEGTIALPDGTEKLTISVGQNHDPGLLGNGWLTCLDQKGTAGQIHASFR